MLEPRCHCVHRVVMAIQQVAAQLAPIRTDENSISHNKVTHLPDNSVTCLESCT